MEKARRLRKRGVRIAVLVHDLIPELRPEWVSPGFREQFRSYVRFLSETDAILCNSESTRMDLLNHMSRRGAKLPRIVSVAPLGSDTDDMGLEEKAPAGIELNREFVLCVGTLESRKNHPGLLDAFDILWQRGPAPSLVLVGRPGYRSEEILRRIRSHPRYGTNLFHLDACGDEELEYLYQRCLFTVLASLCEGFGIPVIESLARGKVYVCSDLSVFRQSAGEYAVYFHPGDAQEIAEAIRRAGADRKLLAERERRIREEYRPPSWADCASAVLAVLGA